MTTELHSKKCSVKAIKDVVTILLVGSRKILAEKHNNKKLAIKLLIVGTGLNEIETEIGIMEIGGILTIVFGIEINVIACLN